MKVQVDSSSFKFLMTTLSDCFVRSKLARLRLSICFGSVTKKQPRSCGFPHAINEVFHLRVITNLQGTSWFKLTQELRQEQPPGQSFWLVAERLQVEDREVTGIEDVVWSLAGFVCCKHQKNHEIMKGIIHEATECVMTCWAKISFKW